MIELDGEKYYTPKETAEKLGVSVGRIAQLRKNKELNYVRVSERKFLYSKEAIRNYLLFSKYQLSSEN